MKARIPNAFKGGITPEEALRARLREIGKKVLDKFSELCNEYPQKSMLEQLDMLLDDEVKKGFPSKNDGERKYVNVLVTTLIEKTVASAVGKNFERYSEEYGSEEQALEKMKKLPHIKSDISEKLSSQMRAIVTQQVNDFIKTKETQLDKNEFKTANANSNIAKTKETQSDENFISKVQGFTNGFAFLADSQLVQAATNSPIKKGMGKFDNIHQYARFDHIRQQILQEMEGNNINEATAIANILERGTMGGVEADILKQRQRVLGKPTRIQRLQKTMDSYMYPEGRPEKHTGNQSKPAMTTKKAWKKALEDEQNR
ncbi:MAG: hypothetical protein J6A89_07235 [Clostridia bacterium]|nr:hypothetical protein [Clostridia bacterium]